MRLGTAEIAGEARVVASMDGELAVALDRGVQLLDVVARWADAEAEIKQLLTQSVAQPVSSLSWLPPIARPGKIVCVALNNSANPDRIMSGPSTPATFVKPSSSLVGHGRAIRLRESYGRVHPEPELAVIIGRGGSDIAHADAYDHVFGYTIVNDLTSPTMRGEDTFHYRAIHPKADGSEGITYLDTWVSYSGRYKGADTFCPMGPWITTADSIRDPHSLIVRCLHQGRVVTEDTTANLTHKVPDVISFLSRYMTLEAGDIISMGTALKASATGGAVQNVDLVKLGGPIEVSISGIGSLINPVELIAEPS